MRCVLDTNIFISAFLRDTSPPARVLELWFEDAYTLVSSEFQLGELRRVSRYPKFRARLKPFVVGGLVNRVGAKALLVKPAALHASPDPDDNLILGTALAASADYLVTGDKSDLLELKKVESVSIVSARDFLARF